MTGILERGILLCSNSRNKSDQEICLIFLIVFKIEYRGNHSEIEITSAFNTSPNFIHCFEMVKLSCKIKQEKSAE